MGYYVNLIETNAYIPCDQLEYAYELVCEINNHHANKVCNINKYDKPSPHEGEWFSWMPWNYPDLHDNVHDILELVGFRMHVGSDGNVWFLGYSDKTGCEGFFLEAIENVLVGANDRPACFLWMGEDNAMWVQEMHDATGCKELVTKNAHFTWE